MNNSRRKDIDAAIKDIEGLEPLACDIRALLSTFKERCNDIIDALNDIENDEQEAFDNLPESLQQGERGLDMEEAISQLQEAKGCLGEHDEIDFDSWEPEEAVHYLAAAKGIQ
jgi:hypothetical protein